jgi:hypothetical protein
MKFLTILIILILKLVAILACSKRINSICCNPKGYRCCCLDEDGKNITVKGTISIREFTHRLIITKITEKMDCRGCEMGFNC